ncbi:bifunctional 4-hydroxy-2-oxoglutarate aldolase/2-dehydro-3-deoxy-phosphogluconate aldolase [Herbiconiux sp. CPCC 205763]|uniref:Bifunctional 4-hydroxy-2-oxoglutarate aldolase/2-dehydro-3-deoxy-phosphogluconate aldolase n=1 Tax=Herbiconiux aconitum TaxID=2970913 RepID=A0ABT2GNT2_9MICO|nr:bifunctional 4-hydroxy-2-oxoglutarate aldolase/2-dehydro-3-deoxy-phosphogluconate aldolase [Herbiconiux aconitum]MCS5716955.1 bifunctional 4-hydroxy-2-oxoglutarate aldolase/2-dehydro-3-deoxy-phosphogluconate aldolase [Herbiconiux aconitum]
MTEHDLSAVRRHGVIAVLRAPSVATALDTTEALLRGGITAIEVTYSTPDPAAVIAEIVRRHGDEVYVGAGTIRRPEQAAEVADAGAAFLVSPGTDAELAAAMKATGAMVMLGGMTPSEVMLASKLGADLVKVFPSSLGGPGYLGALRGPFPDIAFMPTGGVTAENLDAWFAAGATAVGAGGDLVSSHAMAAGDWETIEATARRFARALHATRATADAAR